MGMACRIGDSVMRCIDQVVVLGIGPVQFTSEVTAADVRTATCAMIREAGYDHWLEQRTGHCIDRALQQLPYVSGEYEPLLQAGRMFNIERSVFSPGRLEMNVADINMRAVVGERRHAEHSTRVVGE